MRLFFTTLLLISVPLCTGRYAVAQEIIYPLGSNISSSYQLSSTDFSTEDTLLVAWTVTNNEGFDLTNLYLTESLPTEFNILSSSVQINGSSISFFFSGPIWGQVFPSFNTYRWAIDLPTADDSLNRSLNPGETLILEYATICSIEGEYFLPFHALCSYGDSMGIFSTADTVLLIVSPGSRIDEQPSVLPEKFFISWAYPNPFNSELTVRFDGNLGAKSQVDFAVYDITGREIFYKEISVFSGKGTIRWRPQKDVASGLYFYIIRISNMVSSGKVVFLK